MVCVSPVLLLDLCFPLLLSHSLRRVCYFFTPFMRPSFLSKLSRFRTHTKTLNPYTLTKLSHHSHQNYKKTPLPHPHPMSHLRHQVCVSGQRVLTKHFRFEFVTSPNAILLCHIIVTSTASNVCQCQTVSIYRDSYYKPKNTTSICVFTFRGFFSIKTPLLQCLALTSNGKRQLPRLLCYRQSGFGRWYRQHRRLVTHISFLHLLQLSYTLFIFYFYNDC